VNVTGSSHYRAAIGRLEALADDLSGRGFVTTLVTGSEQPNVTVLNKAAVHLSETVYAAPAGDGSWWLWWSWAERIAPVDDVDIAVLKIVQVLTVP
jgi:hypothetical protein